ncbi:MAG: hypothetical protein V2A62_01365 [Candidatus Woesearchaeota archaeon]
MPNKEFLLQDLEKILADISLHLEKKIGRTIISKDNYLHLEEKKKRRLFDETKP